MTHAEAIEAVQNLGERLDDLEDRAIKLSENAAVQSLADQLHQMRALRSALGIRERAVEDLLAALLTEKVTEIPGIGAVEKRKGATRKNWDSDQLLPTLIRHDLIEATGGEIPTDPMELVEAVTKTVRECAPITPSMQWRVGALKARNFDPDEWCQSTPGRTTVQFHGEPS